MVGRSTFAQGKVETRALHAHPLEGSAIAAAPLTEAPVLLDGSHEYRAR